MQPQEDEDEEEHSDYDEILVDQSDVSAAESDEISDVELTLPLTLVEKSVSEQESEMEGVQLI